jgi:hypothetical protein
MDASHRWVDQTRYRSGDPLSVLAYETLLGKVDWVGDRVDEGITQVRGRGGRGEEVSLTVW